jgi:hypothetical protein
MPLSALIQPAGTVLLLQRRIDAGRAWSKDTEDMMRELGREVMLCEPADVRADTIALLWCLRVAAQWAERGESPPRPVSLVAEVTFARLFETLPQLEDTDPDLVEEIFGVWRHCGPGTRFMFANVFLHRASEALLGRLRDRLAREQERQKSPLQRLADGPALIRRGAAPQQGARDNALLLARITARLGDVDGALTLLEDEPAGDPRVLETQAAVLLAAGRQPEALEQLRRALIKSRHSNRIRERMVDQAIRMQDADALVEHVLTMLADDADLSWWHLLNEWLLEHAPQRLDAVRVALHHRALPRFVEVLMEEGDVAGVSETTSAKTFSHEQLWRLGDFLADPLPQVAESLYERAILLQGSVAHSKAECAILGERVERVIPFFERLSKPTKPRRLFRELLERARSNVPLRREFERLFAGGPA